MKTTAIKTAFVIAMLATGSAIALTAGNLNPDMRNNIDPIETLHKNAEDEKPQTIRTWVKNHLKCPEFVQSNENNRVELWLKCDSDGNVEIIQAKSESERLIEFVNDELNGKICPVEESEGIYHFAIQFKRIG